MADGCKTCHFWSPTPEETDPVWGECRFNAPLPEMASTTPVNPTTNRRFVVPVWPSTRFYDWCGRYELGTAPQPQKSA